MIIMCQARSTPGLQKTQLWTAEVWYFIDHMPFLTPNHTIPTCIKSDTKHFNSTTCCANPKWSWSSKLLWLGEWGPAAGLQTMQCDEWWSIRPAFRQSDIASWIACTRHITHCWWKCQYFGGNDTNKQSNSRSCEKQLIHVFSESNFVRLQMSMTNCF